MRCLKRLGDLNQGSLAFALALVLTAAGGEEILVSNEVELKAAEKARPGDSILLSDGAWRDLRLKLHLSGTAEAPIILRPANEGKVSIEGESALEIVAEHVVLDGLVFRNGTSPYGQILRLEGSHCRVTRCSILDFNPEDPTGKYDWVSLHGKNHRVDRCRFSGQNHPGVTLVVWLARESDGRHVIERNHFGPRAPGNGNGFETIRIGDSMSCSFASKCIVRENLFYRCDGELETVSNKSCENEYTGNTFRECAGCLTLRQGNDCLVRSNYFLGGGKKHTGGIRVMGEGHRIEKNVIFETDGRAEGAIALSAGNENPRSHEYVAARNVVLAGNLFEGNKGPAIAFDHNFGSRKRTVLPSEIMVTGNQFVGSAESDVKGELGDEIAAWKHNRFGGAGTGSLNLKTLSPGDVGPGSDVETE